VARVLRPSPAGDWPQLTSAGTLAAPPELVPAAPSRMASNGEQRLPREGALPGAASPSVFFPPDSENVPFEHVPGRPSFPPTSEMLAATHLQARLSALINAYRVRGHLYAKMDPLGLGDLPPTELALERYGLDTIDPATVFSTDDLTGPPTATLGEIVERLRETYTRTIGVEYTFLEDKEARDWLQDQMESTNNHTQLDVKDQVHILTKLTDAEIFEQFLHTKFIGAKRFSLEGGESVIPLLDLLIERGADHGADEIVIGMAHRGRLNVMVNILEMDAATSSPASRTRTPSNLGRGDVKYHLGTPPTARPRAGKRVHMTLAFNPSHLEWVNPVVEGRVRAKQDRKGDKTRARVLPLLIHGDAPSSARASSPRRSTSARSAGTAPAAPCTSSSTTRWASPPTPKTRAPPATARTSRACCAAPSST
jgi:2-oxoglutarate dehydrogenase complex dehydrogenase (E1) component-like enzyme